jgi:F-type H+-transporting ATPase subunit delta
MIKPLSGDARQFVQGVTSYIGNDKKSSALLPKVSAFLDKVSSQAKKEKRATIETAIALTQNEEKQVSGVLAKLLGHEVELSCTVNKDVIGGIRIQVGDLIVDTSLRESLHQMASTLQ